MRTWSDTCFYYQGLHVCLLPAAMHLILKTNVFPSQWKISQICPVYKKGNKTDLKNYRPVAHISNFVKIFESLLQVPLYRHTMQALSQYPHRFMKGRSTETNLVSIIQTLCEAIDTSVSKFTLSRYTDFSNPFDRIDHSDWANWNISVFQTA